MIEKEQAAAEFIEKVVNIRRVAKVVKGGRRFSFSALVVVGDGAGRVGTGKGNAKKSMVEIPLIDGRTIPHAVLGKFGAGEVMLKPASAGTGVIAGGPVRAVLEAVGLKDILTKSLGSSNANNMVHATMEGLKSLKRIEEVARQRGKTIDEIKY